jgi:hypothetical protein
MGAEPIRTSPVEAANDFAQRMAQMQEEAKAALEHAADEMARYYDRRRGDAPTYKVGDKVWLNTQNYTTDRPTKKLDHKWIGPFEITKVVSPAAVKLRLTARQKGIHPVVSVSNVRPHSPDTIPERPQDPQPGPEIIDGEEEYEVEKILDSRRRYRRLQYLVKFHGWPNSANEWLPAESMENSADIVGKFHDEHPQAPGPPHRRTREPTPRRRRS